MPPSNVIGPTEVRSIEPQMRKPLRNILQAHGKLSVLGKCDNLRADDAFTVSRQE
jgi:hypothetical protein